VPAASLALLLAVSAPTLWLKVDVGPDSPCRVEALAAALRVQRPDTGLALGSRPNAFDLEADLTESSGTLTLTVRGPGKPLTRVLPAPSATCEETLQTAALMIDRYLDELHADAEEAHIEHLVRGPGPRLQLLFGPSVAQAPAGLSPGLTLELDLRSRLFLLSLGGEASLSQKKAIASFDGAYDLTPAAAWLAAGVAPRLGPGRVLVQASFGLTLLWVGIQSSLSPPLPHQHGGNAVDPFLGLRAGYAFDLPARFSLVLRYEERFVPAPTTFSVDGYPGSVSVRSFSGDLALMAGYAFF
jgi:hypothetical protein